MASSTNKKMEIEVPKTYDKKEVMNDLTEMEKLRKYLFWRIEELYEENEKNDKKPLDRYMRIYKTEKGPYGDMYDVHTFYGVNTCNFRISKHRITSNQNYFSWHFKNYNPTNGIKEVLKHFNELNMLNSMDDNITIKTVI